MPLRLLFYMCEILHEHAVNAKHKKYDKNIEIKITGKIKN